MAARAQAERRERRKAAALFQVMKAVHMAEGTPNALVSNLLAVAKDIMECEHVTMFFVDAARNVLIAANPCVSPPLAAARGARRATRGARRLGARHDGKTPNIASRGRVSAAAAAAAPHPHIHR